MSAFDLATSYPDLGKKLFPDGACHPSISEISEDILGAAWALFESLEKRIAAATSLAAKSVNRNQVGYKRYNFRPLRYQFYDKAIRCQIHSYFFQRIAFDVCENLGYVFTVSEGMYMVCKLCFAQIVTHQMQDQNAEKSGFDLLEEALKHQVCRAATVDTAYT